MKAAVTISLIPELKGGPFVFNDLDDGFAEAEALGFDGVELFPPGPQAIDLARVRMLMQRHALAVAAVGTGAGWLRNQWRLTDPNAMVRQQAREFCSSIVEVAGQLGAPAIIGSMQGRYGDGVSREQALDYLATELAWLGEIAARHGQPLLYEPLNRYESNLIHGAAEAAAFLNDRGLSNVKLLCDLFHMNIEETDIAAALRSVAARVGHVHFADSNRRAVGLGHLNVEPVAAALCDIDYRGYLSAEVLPLPNSATAASTTIASIRAWFPNSQRASHAPT